MIAGGELIRFDAGLKPEDLSGAARGGRWCLLIAGSGGNGKTSHACQIARWGLGVGPDGELSDDSRYRLAMHRMLPLLVEPGEGFERCANSAEAQGFLQARLQNAIQREKLPERLVRVLLEQQRILVVIDSLSEMTTSDGKPFSLVNFEADFPIHDLVVTTRVKGAIRGFSATDIRPMPLGGHHLARFLEDYFKIRSEKTSRLEVSRIHSDLEEISKHLPSGLNVMFAKQYAEVVIADRKKGRRTTEHLRSLPEIVHEYLKLSWQDLPEGDELTQDAKRLAWACVGDRLLPKEISMEQAATVVGTEERVVRLLEFSNVLRRSGDDIKFTLDPVAEHLAARFLLEMNAGNEVGWRRFLERLPATRTEVDLIRGFLVGLMETCANLTDDRLTPLGPVMKRLGELDLLLRAFDSPAAAPNRQPIASR